MYGRVEVADVDAELERARRDDAAERAPEEALLDLPPVGLAVAPAVGRDEVAAARVPRAPGEALARVAQDELDELPRPPGQEKGEKFPTLEARISIVFHSFWLIFGRAIISRGELKAWMLFSRTSLREHSR